MAPFSSSKSIADQRLAPNFNGGQTSTPIHTPPVTLPNVVLAAPDIGIKYFSSGHSGAFPRIKWLIVVSALVSTGSIVNAAGPEVELKEKFGIWSLYCLKEAAQHCSITSGVYAKDNPQFWTKVAVTINSASGDLEMTVRTPVLKYFRNGVSLGFDGRQAVKGYIDTCSESSCESAITLNERLVDQIGTGERCPSNIRWLTQRGGAGRRLRSDRSGAPVSREKRRHEIGPNGIREWKSDEQVSRSVQSGTVGPRATEIRARDDVASHGHGGLEGTTQNVFRDADQRLCS